MIEHDGDKLEYVIRRNGYSISDLAIDLRVNRRTIYNWFKQTNVNPKIISDIGNIIRHDFSKNFPDMEFSALTGPKNNVTNAKSDFEYQEKYISLLEAYNKLLNDKIKSNGDTENETHSK